MNSLATVVPAAEKLRTLHEEWLRSYGVNTRKLYRTSLESFRAFVGAPDLASATRELLCRSLGDANALVLAYRTHLVESGSSTGTVNVRLSAVKSLVRLGRTLGLVTWSLEVGRLPHQAYRDTRGPGGDGVRAMLGALDAKNTPKAVRDRAIIRLLYERGLRRGEVVSLDLEHVDFATGRLSVLGKGRTEREWLTLASPTLAALRAWVAVRGEDPGPLFTNFDHARKGTANGRRLTGAGLYDLVRKLGGKVGLRTRPHGLRHAAITVALDRTGGNLRMVQRFSRHRDVRTVGLYDDAREDLGGEVARLIAGEAA